jgi:serine/threonine-protein kinase
VGFVAVGLYDGAFLYDFDAGELHLIDLGEYRPGPFVLQGDRLPGSRRFMAPEEWRRGSTIETRTTVHAPGRAIRLLLSTADEEHGRRGSAARLRLVERATRTGPAERFTSVAELTAAWRNSTHGAPGNAA